MMEFAQKIANKLHKKYGVSNVDVAIVLGSGHKDGVPVLKNAKVVEYEKLGMPKSRVKGHSGTFIFGEYEGKNVVLVSRVHYYESGTFEMVRMPLEIMYCLGARLVILLTSSGGLNKSFKVGDLMLISDHINMTGVNPLVGIENLSFTDMTDCYNSEIRAKIKKIASKCKINLKEGLFCQMSGPNYETKAEIEMLRMFGGDAVSMSTAHDCIVANYLGMKVLGISVIVNVFEDVVRELTHKEVLENAATACKNLKILLEKFIA